MMFRTGMWLIGVAMRFESMRRGFTGGSMLALFVIKEFGLDKAAVPTMNFLRGYLALEEKLIPKLPSFLSYLVMPFTDYHDSAKLYLEIIDILAIAQRPPTCQFYW